MNSRTIQVGITFGHIKRTYLYFDYIIPVYLPAGFPEKLMPPGMERLSRAGLGDKVMLHPAIWQRLNSKTQEWLSRASDSKWYFVDGPSILPDWFSGLGDVAA